jgi:hypothetical protein
MGSRCCGWYAINGEEMQRRSGDRLPNWKNTTSASLKGRWNSKWALPGEFPVKQHCFCIHWGSVNKTPQNPACNELAATDTSFEFMIQIPAGLPPSRTTKYDRIFHTLTAATFNPAPDYAGSKSSFLSRSLPGALKKAGTLPAPFDKSLCSSTSTIEIEVFTAPEAADDRHMSFKWSEEVEGLGLFELKASTDAVS